MRILIVVAAVGAVLGPACASPALDDCQFTCSAEETCPDGTSCVAGACRSAGATGACLPSGPDGGGDGGEPDGQPHPVDSGISCPASPCDGVPVAVGDHCGVECAAQSFSSASATCARAGWRLAVVDTDAKRAAFKAAFDQVVGWVGLIKTNDGVSGWQWLTTPATDQPADELAHPPWAPGEPAANRLFGTLDTTGGIAVLATSPGPELAFCEPDR